MEEGKRREGGGGMGLFYNHNESSEHCAKQFPPSMSAKRKDYGCKTDLQRNLHNCSKMGGDADVLSFMS